MKNIILLLLISFSLIAQQKQTIVIVHGATGGGWAWKDMDQRLTAEGYDVYRPTLTGLGERVHLADTSINLSTHIQDIVNVILFEELDNIILVGHSYGGCVITGVADRLGSKIEQLIYLDAHILEDGLSAIATREAGRKGIMEHNKNGFFSPPWVDVAKIPGDTPQSMATLTEPIKLQNPSAGNGLPRLYILTVDDTEYPEKDAFFKYKAIAESKSWKVVEMRADHNPQRSNPVELTKIITNYVANTR
jgi:pimeloyl-ACP methyl ester carboxylesterase